MVLRCCALRFRDRIARWFIEFLRTHQTTPPSGPICVVSHGAYITTLVSLLLSEQCFGFKRGSKVNLRNGCHNTMIMKVECVYVQESGRWEGEVLSWGDIEHLRGIKRVHHSSKVADDVKA